MAGEEDCERGGQLVTLHHRHDERAANVINLSRKDSPTISFNSFSRLAKTRSCEGCGWLQPAADENTLRAKSTCPGTQTSR